MGAQSLAVTRLNPFTRLRSFRLFRRDRRGASMVEMSIALPVLILLTGGIVEGGVLIYMQNTMNQYVQEAARGASLGILTEAEAETFLTTQLTANLPVNFTSDVVMPNPADPADVDIVVTAVVSGDELATVTPFGFITPSEMRVSHTVIAVNQ